MTNFSELIEEFLFDRFERKRKEFDHCVWDESKICSFSTRWASRFARCTFLTLATFIGRNATQCLFNMLATASPCCFSTVWASNFSAHFFSWMRFNCDNNFPPFMFFYIRTQRADILMKTWHPLLFPQCGRQGNW